MATVPTTQPTTPAGDVNKYLSSNQQAFVSAFAKSSGLNPTVAAAWLRNEEPRADQNTDPAGHGRYNFLNIGITDNKSFGAKAGIWNDPAQAGALSGKWATGQYKLPGYGGAASSLVAKIAGAAGKTPQEQIRAIQTSGWASGGETALPGLYSSLSGIKIPDNPKTTGLVTTPAPTKTGNPIQPSVDLSLPKLGVKPQSNLAIPALSTGNVGADNLIARQQSLVDYMMKRNASKIAGQDIDPTGVGLIQTLQASAAPQQQVAQSFANSGGNTSGPSLGDWAKQTQQTVADAPIKPGTYLATLPNGAHVVADSKKIAKAADQNPNVSKVVDIAKKYLGTPYVFGGETPKTGFDCSGLVQYAYAQEGISIPRTAAEQFRAGKPVALANLKPGDAVFFIGKDGTKTNPGHMGMYVGNGQYIQAPHTGDVVKISNLSDHAGYLGARTFG